MSGLAPRLHEGVYAFVCVPPATAMDGLHPIASMTEAEGLTLVLPLEEAESRGFEVLWRGCWITLEQATELSLVGLTAQFATALAHDGIACNVIAGAHHDHLFVPEGAGQRSQAILSALAL